MLIDPSELTSSPMKNKTHDTQMSAVYAHIYQSFYAFEKGAMKAARNLILKNLGEIGLSISELPSTNVLNVGTGREAVVFHELGAKQIFHFDVSDKSVKILNQLNQQDEFKNIHSRQLDICRTEGLGIEEKIDFVYLNGVLHHLHNPENAIRNFCTVISPNAKLFFRIYRSGSFAFFLVDFIRKFIRYEDSKLTTEIFESKFGSLSSSVLYNDMYDDFFVPVLNLFDPRSIDDFFLKQGCNLPVQKSFAEYDHSSNGRDGQGWSLYYDLPEQINYDDVSFPSSIDQMDDLDYKEPTINKTVKMMRQSLPYIIGSNDEERISLALDLYKRSQLYLSEQHHSFEENHAAIQEFLSDYSSRSSE